MSFGDASVMPLDASQFDLSFENGVGRAGHQHRLRRRRPIRCASAPPRVSTSTRASSQPRRMPATTAAQAPVPQASVSPAPRSNTRSAMCVARQHLHEAGVDLAAESAHAPRSRGPSAATGARSTSSTRCTACGLPIDSTATSTLASISSSGQSSKSPTRARRQARGVERDARVLEHRRVHVHGDAAVVAQLQLEQAVDGLDARCGACRSARVAHEAHEAARAVAAMLDLVAAGVEDAVAEVDARRARLARPPGSGRRRRRNGGRPARAHCSVLSSSGARVASSTTKSLPAPCILVKRNLMAAIIGARRQYRVRLALRAAS